MKQRHSKVRRVLALGSEPDINNSMLIQMVFTSLAQHARPCDTENASASCLDDCANEDTAHKH